VTGAGIPAIDLYSDGMTIGGSLLKPLFIIRYHLPASPFFALVTAMGVLRLRRPLVIAMTVAVAMLNLVEDYSYYRAPSFEDWLRVVDFVARHAQPGDRLLIFPLTMSKRLITTFRDWIIRKHYLSKCFRSGWSTS